MAEKLKFGKLKAEILFLLSAFRFQLFRVVEAWGFEPQTSSLQSWRSTN